MELVLVLPVFLLLLFAIVEFSMLTSARLRVADAARLGVRSICIANTPNETVRSQITEALGPSLARDVEIQVERPKRSGEVVNVRIAVPMSNATPDLLWMTGFSIRHRTLVAEAPMVREHDVVSVGETGQE